MRKDIVVTSIWSLVLTACIGLQAFAVAGLIASAALVLMFLYSIVMSRGALTVLPFVIGLSPFYVLLRDQLLSYSVYTWFLILIIANIFIFSRSNFSRVFSHKLTFLFTLLFSSFIFYGVIIGSDLIKFMKFVEMTVGMLLVVLCMQEDKLRDRCFEILGVSTLLVWLAMLPGLETRFVMKASEGVLNTDPSSMAAFIVVVLVWNLYKVQNKSLTNVSGTVSLSVISSFLVLLLLSTSRTNLSISLVLVTIFSLFRFSSSVKLVGVMLPILFVVSIVIQSSTIDTLSNYYIDKIFASDRTLNQITSHRYDQWVLVLAYIANTDFLTLLLGLGPGKGAVVAHLFSMYGSFTEMSSLQMYLELHSLYLTIFVEGGLIFLVAFLVLLFELIKVRLLGVRRGAEMQLLFAIAWAMTLFANSGLGMSGALMLGCALSVGMSLDRSRLRV